MLKNYLKTALRNLLKHKADSGINLVGLCIAFTSALLLFLSVYYEFSYDDFHRNKQNLYQAVMGVQRPDRTELGNALPPPFAPTLKASYPEVKHISRNVGGGCLVQYKEKKIGQNVRFADPDFLKMFTFPMVQGNAAALADPTGIVLTQEAAKALFGSENPMGKTLNLQLSQGWKGFTVTGVMADLPDNSSIRFDVLVRFDQLPSYAETANTWGNWNHQVYVQLEDGADAADFSRKSKPFMERYFGEDIDRLKRDGAKPNAHGSYMFVDLHPLASMHTDTQTGGEGSAVSASYLYLLLTVGLLIVLIACINFINLSIGRSFTRTREIGLRKTLGALPWQLALQFWCEIVLVCLAAFAISLAAAYLLMPRFRLLFGMNIRPEMLLQPSILGIGALVFLLVTLVAGGYPVWLIARMQVADVLRGKAAGVQPSRVRNGLIVAQFSIATLLIICTIIAWQQIDFLRSKPLGYNRHQIISIPVSGETAPARALELMRQELAGKPGIQSVSGIYNNLGYGTDGSSRRSVMGFDYENREIKTTWMAVSHDFVNTLDLHLIAGHDFRRGNAADSNCLVVNEAMAAQLTNGKDIRQAMGALLNVHDSQPNMKVIGVVKDFHFESLHKKILPMSLVLEPDFGINYILVKVDPANLPASMALLKASWKKVEPNGAFMGSFLDENIGRQYKQEERLGRMFITGAVTAIALSCMGLLAIVILVLAQRTREIGIRKVLGASVATIIAFIFKDFLRLVVIAILIASPLGWIAMNSWLQDYSYRIPIHWWVFALAGGITVSIALLTVLARALQAATANPIKSLRTE